MKKLKNTFPKVENLNEILKRANIPKMSARYRKNFSSTVIKKLDSAEDVKAKRVRIANQVKLRKIFA